MDSSFYAVVRKRDGRWTFRVFEFWNTSRQLAIVQGDYPDWLTSYAQAAGTVSSFRSAYERKSQ